MIKVRAIEARTIEVRTIEVRTIEIRTELSSAISTGGARRDRTDDLLLAKQALSQLSYGPLQGSAIRNQPSEMSAI
jgi:hypothetical protein